MKFEIKGLKEWQGRDGCGYQFNLWVNGKKFAWVHNEGNGGEIDFHPYDLKRMGGEHTFETSPSYKLLADHVASLLPYEFNGKSYPQNIESFMAGLVEDHAFAKTLKRARKTGVPFRLLTDSPLEFSAVNTTDLVKAKEWLDKNYPNNYQFL